MSGRVTTKSELKAFLERWARSHPSRTLVDDAKLRAKIQQRGWTVTVWAPDKERVDLYVELKPRLACGVHLLVKKLRWWHKFGEQTVIVKEVS